MILITIITIMITIKISLDAREESDREVQTVSATFLKNVNKQITNILQEWNVTEILIVIIIIIIIVIRIINIILIFII